MCYDTIFSSACHTIQTHCWIDWLFERMVEWMSENIEGSYKMGVIVFWIINPARLNSDLLDRICKCEWSLSVVSEHLLTTWGVTCSSSHLICSESSKYGSLAAYDHSRRLVIACHQYRAWFVGYFSVIPQKTSAHSCYGTGNFIGKFKWDNDMLREFFHGCSKLEPNVFYP